MNTLSWKNATTAQLNFWNQVRGLIAWNTITPLYFKGAIAASEFLIYNAAKFYIALDLKFDFSSGNAANASAGRVILYDQANVASFTMINNSLAWDVTAAAFKYCANTVESTNICFSRILNSLYNEIIFNGYRLDIV